MYLNFASWYVINLVCYGTVMDYILGNIIFAVLPPLGSPILFSGWGKKYIAYQDIFPDSFLFGAHGGYMYTPRSTLQQEGTNPAK